MKNQIQNRREEQFRGEEIQEAGACAIFSRLTDLTTCESKLQGPYFNEVGSLKWETPNIEVIWVQWERIHSTLEVL